MSFILLTCGGAGTTPVDSGLPRTGELYGVEANGDLRWYRYDGNGQATPDGSIGWAANSGNVVGRGWDSFKFLCGGGDGQLFGVERNGDLRWYQYLAGDGVQDRAGARGWHANSGNTIGNGFHEFTKLVCTPKVGRTGTDPSTGPAAELFGVSPNGELRWYRYEGNGVADRSGHIGWAPNSGNVIGTGWHSFNLIFTAGDVLFGIEPDGDLRWFSYGGRGEPDKSGWRNNTGNVIGRGWDRFRTIVGGPNDRFGFGYEIFAVEPNGNLFWYKYFGHGESDPSGSTGWHPNSGNQIGRGW